MKKIKVGMEMEGVGLNWQKVLISFPFLLNPQATSHTPNPSDAIMFFFLFLSCFLTFIFLSLSFFVLINPEGHFQHPVKLHLTRKCHLDLGANSPYLLTYHPSGQKRTSLSTHMHQKIRSKKKKINSNIKIPIKRNRMWVVWDDLPDK